MPWKQQPAPFRCGLLSFRAPNATTGVLAFSVAKSDLSLMTRAAHHANVSSPRPASWLGRVLAALRRGATVVRRMIGVPDYDTYLAHMRARYPECTPIDQKTFERERLTARYKSTGSRCC